MAFWLSHIAAHLQPIFKGRYYFGCKRAAIFPPLLVFRIQNHKSTYHLILLCFVNNRLCFISKINMLIKIYFVLCSKISYLYYICSVQHTIHKRMNITMTYKTALLLACTHVINHSYSEIYTQNGSSILFGILSREVIL